MNEKKDIIDMYGLPEKSGEVGLKVLKQFVAIQ